MAEQEVNRAEEVAKRAAELASRAEELARHAHEVAGVDEQLAALEAELDSLVAEEEALDAGVTTAGEAEPGRDDPREEWTSWTEAFGNRMEALGDRLGDLISGSVDAALHSSILGPSSFGRTQRAQFGEGEAVLPVASPLQVKVESKGGSVEVRTGPPGTVRVNWHSRGWPRGTFDQEPVTVTESDGIVLVESSGGRSWRPNVMRIVLEVPPGLPLEVTTGGGSVRVEGTNASVAVRTGGGSISITDVDGEVSATTGGGSVRVQGRLRGQSWIRTGGGSVDVVLSEGSRIDLDAKGTSAAIDVPGLRVHGYHVTGTVNGGGEGRLEVQTGGGSARISQA